MTWKAGNESTVRGYKFTYDGLDRLLNATYGETAGINANTDRFSENVTAYDKNGNIKTLQRYGQTGASTYGLIDNLTFTLGGNQLTRVDDAVATSAYNNGFEYKDGVKQANEYNYDSNGNSTKDLNKGITNISYNCLNLPSVVTFSDGSTITYTYGADGTKLRTVHKIGSTTTTTDYCGNVVYENGVQKLLLTDEGYVTLSDNKYHYYLKDHQGNNRVVINQSGSVEETNHYYPFGGVFASTTSVQPYKYNGKEFDTKKGLNWYDYGARHYDVALGRFTTVDPLSERYYSIGMYAYCNNNPVRYIDPTGMSTSPIYDEEGKLLGTDDEGLQGVAIIMSKSNFKQGMSHEEALSHDLGYNGLVDDEARTNYLKSYTSLKDRPDYDGYLTKAEADAWWKGKSGDPLFVDQSKIELHGINTSSFKGKNPIYKNFIWRLTNTGKTYGTLKMTLIDAEKGKVFIGLEKYMDKYDFNMDGRFFRDFATWVMIQAQTEAQKTIIASHAIAQKRMQEGYTYQQERSFDVAQDAAKNEGAGGLTGLGIGIGAMAGVGGSVGGLVGNAVRDALHSTVQPPEAIVFCENCGAELPQDATFCDNCGHAVARDKNICAKCGYRFTRAGKFCPKCGAEREE